MCESVRKYLIHAVAAPSKCFKHCYIKKTSYMYYAAHTGYYASSWPSATYVTRICLQFWYLMQPAASRSTASRSSSPLEMLIMSR